jgi:hypothetical protein
MDGYVAKPGSIDDVRTALRAVLDARRQDGGEPRAQLHGNNRVDEEVVI